MDVGLEGLCDCVGFCRKMLDEVMEVVCDCGDCAGDRITSMTLLNAKVNICRLETT